MELLLEPTFATFVIEKDGEECFILPASLSNTITRQIRLLELRRRYQGSGYEVIGVYKNLRKEERGRIMFSTAQQITRNDNVLVFKADGQSHGKKHKMREYRIKCVNEQEAHKLATAIFPQLSNTTHTF
mmetsp:Transcript_14888/g.20799  ORF Transcript_14888/g.20799 Transcript_14888/m.20799 type:complete len:129 (+) Transcript_14888:186-572(+)